jgi:hypothetical protein
MSKSYESITTNNMRKAHEATEVAKLAVQLCQCSHAVNPEDFVQEALDLIILAGNLIEEEERKRKL